MRLTHRFATVLPGLVLLLGVVLPGALSGPGSPPDLGDPEPSHDAMLLVATAESLGAQPPPTFVCGGEPCAQPRTPKPGDRTAYPAPPRWLTSPNAGACIANAVPGMQIVNDFNQVFQIAPELARTKGFLDPDYWLIQLRSFGSVMTFPECRAWKDELTAAGTGGGGSW